VWVSATSPDGIHVLTSPDGPAAAALMTAALWAGALLLGRERGPALRAPFPTYVLALSGHPRTRTFRGPVLRAGLFIVVLTSGSAGLVAAALATSGFADLTTAARFVSTAAMVGIVTTTMWLAGQVFPRTALLLAPAVLAGGILTATSPVLLDLAPWGWAGLAYPTASVFNASLAFLLFTGALLLAVPPMLTWLEYGRLAAQSSRWEQATSHAHGLELDAIAVTYQALPCVGRRLRAVRPRRNRAVTFILRDATGAIRTPGRLICGITGIGIATVLIVSATPPGTPELIASALAGVVMFTGLGPITDGLRHAASVAADFPLYGISDAQLMAHHTLFPLVVIAITVPTTALVASMILNTSLAGPMLGALTLGAIALPLRISGALKGPLPTALLTPIPTPVGDISAATRMAWAVDGILLAATAGASVALLPVAPALPLALLALVAGVIFVRWRKRA
jgi:hypothetical protein